MGCSVTEEGAAAACVTRVGGGAGKGATYGAALASSDCRDCSACAAAAAATSLKSWRPGRCWPPGMPINKGASPCRNARDVGEMYSLFGLDVDSCPGSSADDVGEFPWWLRRDGGPSLVITLGGLVGRAEGCVTGELPTPRPWVTGGLRVGPAPRCCRKAVFVLEECIHAPRSGALSAP